MQDNPAKSTYQDPLFALGSRPHGNPLNRSHSLPYSHAHLGNLPIRKWIPMGNPSIRSCSLPHGHAPGGIHLPEAVLCLDDPIPSDPPPKSQPLFARLATPPAFLARMAPPWVPPPRSHSLPGWPRPPGEPAYEEPSLAGMAPPSKGIHLSGAVFS